MNIDKYNERQEKMTKAQIVLIHDIRNLMNRFELNNTETTSVLAQVTASWAHFSFHDSNGTDKQD